MAWKRPTMPSEVQGVVIHCEIRDTLHYGHFTLEKTDESPVISTELCVHIPKLALRKGEAFKSLGSHICQDGILTLI